jgi:hypothetical protein
MSQELDVVRKLRKLARDDSTLVALALLAHAEAACSSGDLPTADLAIADAERIAVEHRDLYLVARSAYASASLAFVRNQLKDAFALFTAASSTIATFDAAYALRAAAFAGRTALLTNQSWSPPLSLMKRHIGSWIHVELDCVAARQLMGVDTERALELAERAFNDAKATDSVVATIYADATVAAALDRSGRSAQSQSRWLACWSEGARLDDHSTLFDLFSVPAVALRNYGPLELTDEFLHAVQDFHEGQVRTTGMAKKTRALTGAILRLCLEGASGKHIKPHLAILSTAQILAALGVSSDQVLEQDYSTSRSTAIAVSWLLPPTDREAFRSSFVTLWDRFVAEIASRMKQL